MSYDLYVYRPDIPEDCVYYVCDESGDGAHWGEDSKGMRFQYTYNLGPFFTDFGVRPSTDLDGLTGKDCAERIDKALHDIYRRDMRELAGRYNPPNHWGSVHGAVNWLRDIRAYCLTHPGFKVWVC